MKKARAVSPRLKMTMLAEHPDRYFFAFFFAVFLVAFLVPFALFLPLAALAFVVLAGELPSMALGAHT
jgi:hypothetical protein